MPTNYIYLTGGLGNQLFQYSALITQDEKYHQVIDVINGNPRRNVDDIPDMLEFTLGSQIKIYEKRMSALTQKSIGYSLRSHLNPKGPETFRIWRKLTRFGASFLLSAHFRRIIFIQVLSDLGDDPRFHLSRGNNFLVGYFQSTRWASSVKNQPLVPCLKANNARVETYRKLAESERPLIVHIRLGDYVSEGGFGIPRTEYYEEALLQQFNSNIYGSIWLFSDEPRKAIEIFPSQFKENIRLIEENFSSAETLEVMRFGKGYVIGNSTFSWWAAYLSYTNDCRVIYPYPWFKTLSDPKNLIPEEWVPVNAYF